MSAALVPINIMGKRYEVPEGLTILKAFEYAGYRLVRGCGCRAGLCGACATVYRVEGDYHLKFALACQTPVQPGMVLTQIPFFPRKHTAYAVGDLADAAERVFDFFPEISRCIGCNSCTQACPQGLPVMEYISAILRGDLPEAAEMSFDCIMCGLCASRCPADIVQYTVAAYVRRAVARHLTEKSPQLARRVAEIHDQKYADQVSNLMRLGEEELKKLYAERDVVKEKY